MPNELIRVGQIVGAFGLKGNVKVEALTDFDDRFEVGTRLRLKGDWVTIEGSKIHKGRPLLKLSGVNNLTAAEALQWEYLEAPAREHPEMEEGEYMVDDLIGLKVVTAAGEDVGTVDEVLAYPAQDVLKVGEILIPMVKEFVKDVDLKKKIIQVELLPGMRD